MTAVADGTAPTSAPRLPSLTGLRWLAAFMVFGFHIGTLHILGKPYYRAKWDEVFGQGASGVAFFFVLSGFVLTWTAQGADTPLRFWRRRFAKIFPNHAVTWALVILVTLAWGDEIRGEVAAGNLLLLQTWFNFDTFPYSINTVSWSLSCEAFFYLCFPFVLPLLRKANAYVLYSIAAALVLVIYEVQNWTADLTFTDKWWLTQLFPPTRSLEFWLGVVVALLVVRKRWFGPGLWVSTAATVAVVVANQQHLDAKYWTADAPAAFALLIAAAARADIAGRWTPWRNRTMVWLGEVSFAFYLVHVAFMSNVLRLLRDHGVHLTGHIQYYLLPGFFLGSLLLAWLLFRFVETPMNAKLRPKRLGAGADENTGTPAESIRITSPAMAGQDVHMVGK
jgi:peptidoglycan/LPS O-acetylase OafA/YrhL